MDRRQLLRHAAAFTAASSARVLGANDRIRLGAIGVGGRCRYLLEILGKQPNCEIAAVCDVYQPRIDKALEDRAPGARAYTDYRRLLEDKSLDAVVIATPDHWHVPIAVDAIKAGKDVYLEKPVTHTLEEGDLLRQTVHFSKQVFQAGMQQRSWAHFQQAREWVIGGKLGKVTLVQTYWYQNYNRRAAPAIPIDPSKLDWKTWLGNAPSQPFNEQRYRLWRWYWDFGGGALTDLFSHWVDVAHWYFNVDLPIAAQAWGNRYVLDWECPDTTNGTWEYPNQFAVIYYGTMVTSLEDGGLVLRGTDGEMKLDRGGFVVYPETARAGTGYPPPSIEVRSKEDGTVNHLRNFLECVRSRQQATNAPVDAGIAAARAAHLGNLALRRGGRVTYREREV